MLGCCGDPGRGLGAPSPEALPVCAQHCVRGHRAPHPQGGHLTPPGSGPSSSRCPPPTAGLALFPGRAAQHPAQQLVPITLRRRRLRAPRPGVDIWAGPSQAPTGPLHSTFRLGPHGLHTYTQTSAEGPAQPGGAQPIHRIVHILAAGWSLKSCTEGLVHQPPPSCGARAERGSATEHRAAGWGPDGCAPQGSAQAEWAGGTGSLSGAQLPSAGPGELAYPSLSCFLSGMGPMAVPGSREGSALRTVSAARMFEERLLPEKGQSHLLTATSPRACSGHWEGGRSAASQLPWQASPPLHLGQGRPGAPRLLHPVHVLTDLPGGRAIGTPGPIPPPTLQRRAGPTGPGADGEAGSSQASISYLVS